MAGYTVNKYGLSQLHSTCTAMEVSVWRGMTLPILVECLVNAWSIRSSEKLFPAF